MLPSITLIGYGKMGREIEALAAETGYDVKAIIDPKVGCLSTEISAETLSGADVCVDFTEPNVVIDNIRACAESGKNVVVGTTGWYDKMSEIENIVSDHNIGLIYASNFSIGVHLFLELVSVAGKVFNPHDQYDVGIHEIHHRMKKDAPSGTAYTIAQTLIKQLTRKLEIVTNLPDGVLDKKDLPVISSRIGSIPGTHQLIFDSPSDTIELTHIARSRRGFAEGALLAAKWIHNRKGLFTIKDMINDTESL